MSELAMIDINPQNCSTLWMQLHVEKKKNPFQTYCDQPETE